MPANFGIGTLVPRTRSSHDFSAGTVANFGFKSGTSVPLLTDDSQIGANLRVCADEKDRADFDQRS
jgi:hypothetical protein